MTSCVFFFWQVGVLSRNVVFEGDEQSRDIAFGAQLMLHTHHGNEPARFLGEQVAFKL
jgi:hypothetical protein